MLASNCYLDGPLIGFEHTHIQTHRTLTRGFCFWLPCFLEPSCFWVPLVVGFKTRQSERFEPVTWVCFAEAMQGEQTIGKLCRGLARHRNLGGTVFPARGVLRVAPRCEQSAAFATLDAQRRGKAKNQRFRKDSGNHLDRD